jgi:hypothetical protein
MTIQNPGSGWQFDLCGKTRLKKLKLVKALMEYSFDVCHAFGEVWIVC